MSHTTNTSNKNNMKPRDPSTIDTKPEGAAAKRTQNAASNDSAKTNANTQLEGEGNYTAARRYNDATTADTKRGMSEALGEDAKEALEGSEGAELRRAEKAGKAARTP